MTTDSAAPSIAEVLLPYALHGAYSYLVPQGMQVQLGSFVEVPLGPRSRIGVVWKLGNQTTTDKKLRSISSVFENPPLTDTHRKFIEWLAAYYLEQPGNVLRMVLRVPSAFGEARETTAYQIGNAIPLKLTSQRARVLDIARDGIPLTARDLAEQAGVGTSVIKALAQQGALLEVQLPTLRRFAEPDLELPGKGLSEEQQQAARHLRETVNARAHKVTLLDGVTGSGKTEVYFEAMAASLALGHQVLLLLPEIALTPAFLARVEERFGVEPAGWHSDLRPRERERVWRCVSEGNAKIVVGARSSLFLPWANLGLIIVDEEHESAYKQEEGVTYHARDMAVLYGALGKFPVVLASATPSLESFVNADRGRYELVALKDRHGRAELPPIDLIDMRQSQTETGAWLSDVMTAAVTETLARGEQALLFLNRRGYAPLTLCRSCGHRMDCPACAASLVEHRFRRILMCHHCGHQEPVPHRCPKCQSEDKLVPVGPGVERLAEEALRRFPHANLTILSSDIARGSQLKESLRTVADGASNLVIGTQLVAKGHHFPFLTFVGIVDADLALESSDPRAGERTWAMLAQVSGRAGRGEKPGHALVQTHQPDHPLMQALKSGNRDSYLTQEKRIRESALLPPFGRLAALILSGDDAHETERFAKAVARLIPDTRDVQVLGPAPAPIALVRGRHRWRFLVKAGRDVNIQAFIAAWLKDVSPKGKLALQIDIDPYSFL